MIVKHMGDPVNDDDEFESSVNSYDSQTFKSSASRMISFESSVNSYDSQTKRR